VRKTPNIAPAEGKLGVLLPGLGSVASTFIAGVEAVKKDLALDEGRRPDHALGPGILINALI
jgi:hypothetical protein